MQKEEFNHIISDIHLLQDTHAKDIRQLTEKYPWFQIPHLLLAKKLQNDHSPNFDAALRKAASYIFDRSVLFQFMEHMQPTKTLYAAVEAEDVKVDVPAIDIQEEFQQEEQLVNIAEIPDEVLHELMTGETFEGNGVEETAIQDEADLQNVQQGQETIPEEPIFEFNLYELEMLKEGNGETLDELVEDVTARGKKTENTNLSVKEEQLTFSEWIRRISGVNNGSIVTLTERHKPLKITVVGNKVSSQEFNEEAAKTLAARSIQLHDNLITETYAIILARQGKKQMAAEMYEKLRLKYPQKSTYFAQKIKEL